MAEEAELVGGISAELRADHSQLPSDIAAANRIVEEQWGAKTFTAKLQVEGGRGGAAGGAAASTVRQQHSQMAAEEERGQQQRLANSVRFAGREMQEVQRSTSAIQAIRVRSGRQAYEESERARRAELAATVKHYDQLESVVSRYFDSEAERLGPTTRRTGLSPQGAERLSNLSYEAEREAQQAPSPTGTVYRTPAQQRAFREQEARRANALVSAPLPQRQPVTVPVTVAEAPPDEIERARRRIAAQMEGGGRGARPAYRQSEEENNRIRQEQIARAEAQRLGQARTPRTAAAGLGGFGLFGGPTRQVIQAQAEQAAANREVARTQANLYKPEIYRNAVAFRKASEEATVALHRQAKATEAVEALATKGTALRSLAAVTVAGAAFGLAMQGVQVGLHLVEQAVGPTLERLTGFATTTATYTDSLSDATRAASGNAQAVTALKLASTGLSASTASTIQPLIQQRAEIEAGNKAIQDQIEAFHVAQNLAKQGGNAGLGGTTGGFLGTPLFGIPSAGEQIGNLLNQLGGPARQRPAGPVAPGTIGGGRGFGPPQLNASQSVQAQADFAKGLQYVNDQLVKGGDSAAQFVQAADKTDARIEQTAAAFDNLSPEMASAIRANNLYSNSIRDVADAARALSAINIAGTLPDPALLAQQFNRQNPALINQANRQQQYALQTQLPAQFALQNLQNPLKPVGTGYQARDAEERRRIQADQNKSIELQKDLNATYEQGAQILQTQYHVPPQLLNDLRATGQAISQLQTAISNEQAAYQVHQYNYQLFIAKRTLQDINGLNNQNLGGVGQSYLGQLEKENLALSRQGQLLQFTLAQRQINFQVASAGFLAPGTSSEERSQRIAEARYEASFAQKQLDIQKQMFGNQVQIVDIQNLRQGQDLLKQIALLTEGRKVTLDVQVKTEEIDRLVAKQQQEVAQIGTYISKVDSLAAAAMGEIQQLELAAGKAIGSVADDILSQFGLALNGMNNQLNSYFGTGSTGTQNNPGKQADDTVRHASGVLGRTSGTTTMTVGEAGSEEVAVLRNPRAYFGAMGGGGAVTVTFNGGITVRSDSDIDQIVRKVEDAINRRAGLIMRTG